ncbi:hypothetical protein CCY01nite_00500 [Chitinophaga cymbidii]|uniref:Uncharacterized protein n=1 Tax=Chitinophaga cymbidii TaxID=1096750 RepID=A0A512RDL6_9BACT|nr:hypothetical protein CCY01nite_00500 [Chitinophaga cymbidii]
MNDDCVSVNRQAFLRCGIRIGLRLCTNAHKKNKLVTRMNGNKYFPALLPAEVYVVVVAAPPAMWNCFM